MFIVTTDKLYMTNKYIFFLELGLRNCDFIKDKGFSYLENLEFLEHLNLYRTHVKTQTLCKILQKNRRMRHLYIGSTDNNLNVDEVVIELKNSCPDLESIDLWKTHTLTSQGIDALAECKNLREVDFGWWYVYVIASFKIQVLSCSMHI